MGSSSSGSILHQNVANCSCLYPLVASVSFGSCLQPVVVTLCPFRHGSCWFQQVFVLVALVLVVFLPVPNAFLTVVRLVFCLFVVVAIQSSCADVDWIIWLSAKTVWIGSQQTYLILFLISKAHIITHFDHRRFHPRRSNLSSSASLWMVIITFPSGREQLSFEPKASIGPYLLPASRRQHMLCSSVAVAEALSATEQASQFLQFRIPLLVSIFSKMAAMLLFCENCKSHSGNEKKNKIHPRKN